MTSLQFLLTAFVAGVAPGIGVIYTLALWLRATIIDGLAARLAFERA